jgi:methylmalonyl-CoA/ethylmalonyl-CoA epimerase
VIPCEAPSGGPEHERGREMRTLEEADMNDGAPNFASAFCQVAWVVRDISLAERFFTQTMGIPKFYKMEGISAADTGGTYLGQPGDWVCDLLLAYSGETQIELIQPVSGSSMYHDALAEHGDAVQHIAYTIDAAEYEAAARHMVASGYPEIQAMSLPIARAGYFDTRPAVGVVTEIVGITEPGRKFFRALKEGRI